MAQIIPSTFLPIKEVVRLVFVVVVFVVFVVFVFVVVFFFVVFFLFFLPLFLPNVDEFKTHSLSMNNDVIFSYRSLRGGPQHPLIVRPLSKKLMGRYSR